MISRNSVAFQTELAIIHPGESSRIVCIMLLSKLAYKMAFEPANFGSDLQLVAMNLTVIPEFK